MTEMATVNYGFTMVYGIGHDLIIISLSFTGVDASPASSFLGLLCDSGNPS
jgi:hypothetical protein